MFHFESNDLIRKGTSPSRKKDSKKICSFESLKKKDWQPRNKDEIKKEFHCELESRRCEYVIPRTKQRCSIRTKKALPYCWQHTQIVSKLNIGRSRIPNAGSGLFACDREAKDKEIIFREDEKVALYARIKTTGKKTKKPLLGETMHEDELTERYGYCVTGPYAIDASEKSKKMTVDTACERSIGSYANHSTTKANAEYAFDKRNNEVWLYATKNIRNGDEILLDYGTEYRLDFPDFFEYNVKQTGMSKTHANCKRRKSSKRRRRKSSDRRRR